MNMLQVAYVALLCLFMSIGTELAAQTPANSSTVPPAASPPVLATEQKDVAERFSRLETLLLRSADLEAGENPARAALLQQAVQLSKQAELTTLLADAAARLTQGQYSEAIEKQKSSRESLKRLLELLQSENRAERIREERDEVRRWIEETDRLLRLQSSLRGRTEGGQDTQQSAKDQQKLTDKASEIAADLPGPETTPDAAAKNPADANSVDPNSDPAPVPEDSPPSSPSAEGTDPSKPSPRESSEPPPTDQSPAADGKSSDKPAENGESADKSTEPKEGQSQPKGDPSQPKSPAGEQSDPPPGQSQDAQRSPPTPADALPKPGAPPSPGQQAPSQQAPSQQAPSQQAPGESSQGQPGGAAQEQQPQTPTERAKQKIKQAQKNMQEAQQQLEQAQREGAVEKQRAAEERLREAIEELEEILRQLREEEVERSLASLETRLRRMLEMQNKVLEETTRLQDITGESANRQVQISASKLSQDEAKILAEGERAFLLLREEGSSAAFPEAIQQLNADIAAVADRLNAGDVGKLTVNIEQEIVASLEEMVEALVQVQKENRKKQQQQQQGQPPPGGEPGDQPLVDKLAELRLIRTLQLRVNNRTNTLSKLLADPNDPIGQAAESDIQQQLQGLATRQSSIQQVTRDIVVGKGE